jgi:hypothetical protein
MPTPSKGYHLQDGSKIPGTTTVCGRFKDSGGLLHWAFQQGKNGARTLYEQAEKAADIGTLAHAMVEHHINGADPEAAIVGAADDMKDKARNAYAQFVKWEKQTKVKMLSKYQEIQLVSPEYRFGGTPDAIGEIDGEIVLLDWKTSNGVYSDYLIQLAAYGHLIERGVRMDTWEPLGCAVPKGYHLLRFSKDFPDFEHRSFGSLETAWEQFKLFRAAYENDRELKKRAA